MSQHKLSFRAAILISLNVMVGFGIFVNTVMLAKISGFLGFVSYALVAVLVAPLIFSMAELVHHHPEGGFYTYGAKTMGKLAGFISAWSYFTSKLASAALIIHVVMTLLQSLLPALQGLPTLALDLIVIALFTFLNTFHMRVGSSIAGIFIVLKLTPLIFAILCGLYLLTTTVPLQAQPLLWAGIPASIPFVVYAFLGFEAVCSLSHSIEDAKRNGPKIIYLAFAMAILINVLYQFLFFAGTGGALMNQSNYLGAFPTLFQTLLPHNPILVQKMVGITHLGIACAALGGAYGILFSTHWNMYILAQNNLTLFPQLFSKLNKHGIPTASVVTAAIVCASYLLITQGNQAPLQQLSALGSTIAYTISVVGLLLMQNQAGKRGLLPRAALVSCGIFTTLCLRNFLLFGMSALYFFATMLTLGLIMFFASTHFQRHQGNQTQND